MQIRGDMLEGGGQILRTAIAFSAVLQEPLTITNIRTKRKPPGLRPQHLNAVKAVAELTSAKVRGLDLGSTVLEFIPQQQSHGQFKVDIGTAGSTTLVLQALMPAIAFGPGETTVTLVGGTNNPMAPTIDFQQTVLMPALAKMGVHSSSTLVRRGFYPRGRGIIKVTVKPAHQLQPLDTHESSVVERVFGLSYSSLLPKHVPERMARSAKQALQERGFNDVTMELEHLEQDDQQCAANPGCGIIVFAQLASGAVLAGDQLGELGKPAEKVGQEAAEHLLGQLQAQAPVDEHLCDQLIPWVSLANGTSKLLTSRLTLHTMTCIEVSKIATGARFEVQGKLGERTLIQCESAGLESRWLSDKRSDTELEM